jgi:hypothetical protein
MRVVRRGLWENSSIGGRHRGSKCHRLTGCGRSGRDYRTYSLCKDMGDRRSLLIAVETEKRSGGVTRFSGIGGITSSSSIAKDTGPGEVKYVVECLQGRGGDAGDMLVSGLC